MAILVCLILFLGSSVQAQGLSETYWDGAGDTPSMNYYEQAGGYLRFTEFPVRVYLELGASDAWEQALDRALFQLRKVLPIIQTRVPSRGDIFIDLIPSEQFPYRAPCDDQHTDACSRMLPIADPGLSNFTLLSRIWIREETPLPAEHVLLHELMHALGLLVHSPHPDDVLFNGIDSTPIILSDRDRATLAYLYNQPAIGEIIK